MNILIKNIDTVRKQEKHIADKSFSRILKLAKKDAANSNEDVVTAAFDLEQVLVDDRIKLFLNFPPSPPSPSNHPDNPNGYHRVSTTVYIIVMVNKLIREQ